MQKVIAGKEAHRVNPKGMIIFWSNTNRLGVTYKEKLILKIVCTRFFFDTHGLDFKKHAGESCRNSNQWFYYLESRYFTIWSSSAESLKSKNIMSISKETHEAQCTGMLETSVHLLLGTLSRIKSLHIIHRISKSKFCKTTNHHHLQHKQRTHHLGQHLANQITDSMCTCQYSLSHTAIVPIAKVPLLNTTMRWEADI